MDLRSFIAVLEQSGNLKRISHAIDWKYELGAYCRSHPEPLLFENILGYEGFSLFANGLCNQTHIARALSLDPLVSRKKLISAIRDRLKKPETPVTVAKSSVFDNSLDDLPALPSPWWHQSDGGRYLGTWHVNVTRDRDTGIHNCGIYRMQLIDSRTSTVSVSPNSHLALHFAKAEKDQRPLEMAVCIGVSESLIMASAAAFPMSACEYDFAGALEQKPFELISCKTIDLKVPSDAEFVIEGVIRPGERVTDGPFFDYAGVPNVNPNALVFEATALWHRSNPIFRGCAVGIAGAEDHQIFSFLAPLGLVDFHGSPVRQTAQNFLLRNKLFSALQLFTRAGHLLHGKHPKNDIASGKVAS